MTHAFFYLLWLLVKLFLEGQSLKENGAEFGVSAGNTSNDLRELVHLGPRLPIESHLE